MKTEDYEKTSTELAGFPVNVTSYRIGDKHICLIDNVSPGAQVGHTNSVPENSARYSRGSPSGIVTMRPKGDCGTAPENACGC